MSSRRTAVAAVLALATASAAAPRRAEANGGNTHAWITFHAIEHLPDGHLKELLTRPEVQTMLLNGSVFPDGGYVVGNDYGEMSHWEPFVTAYVAWMIRTQPRPFNHGRSAELTAFLMGLASHGMADQVFDASFMDAARIHDAENWSEELLDGFDTATDVMLVADTGVSYLGFEPWVPAEEIAGIFLDDFAYTVSPDDLWNAQDLLHRFVLNFGVSQAADAEKLAAYRARYPWAAQNLMDPTFAGGPPCEGEIVAAYMQALWDRLHATSGAQNWVVATYPKDGSAGHPTDHTMVEAQVFIVSGHGLRRDELAAHVEVKDASGKVYDVDVGTQWGAAEANLIKIRANEDWAADQDFTVTISPGLETLDGLVFDQPFTMSFSTRDAMGAPVDPTSDPTPHEGEPDPGEPPATPGDDGDGGDGGGCAAAGQGAGGLGGLGGAAWLLVALCLAARYRRGARRPH